MEQAVLDDIRETQSRVPFHNSLEKMALALAREVDAGESKASKATAIRQLYEVLTKLRGEEGDGDGDSSTDALLEAINGPLVPGMPT